ncbi:MAG TPA: AI-2E family transporter [Pirellulales bacterium]|nr:AI-2E family transporter [Pirellulales bacterium]
MARIVSFVMLVAILLVMGALFFEVMAGFFVPLFLAVLLVVMFRPLHRWFVGRCRGRERLAAGLTTLAILSIVMAPLLFVLIQAGFEASTIAERWNTEAVKERLAALRDRTGLSLPSQAALARFDELDAALAGWPKSTEQAERAGLTEVATALDALVTTLADELQTPEAPNWAAVSDKGLLQADLDLLAAALPKLREAITQEGATKDITGLVNEVQSRLDTVRADVLGSPWKRWMKRQVNPSDEQLAIWRRQARDFADSLAVGGAQYAGNVLPDLMIGLAVMIVALYYFLADGPTMIKSLMRLSPLDDRYEEQLLNEFSTVTRAVVVATLLSALVQGLLAGIGYLFAGLGSVALLTMLTMLFSLVPFIGGTAVWIPCCLWLFLEGRMTAAIVLALYCGVVVSTSDNIIKPLVLQGQSNLHPLLALLSVLGGVKALGPIGILVGPMIVAFLQALLKMVQIELDHLSKPAGAASS